MLTYLADILPSNIDLIPTMKCFQRTDQIPLLKSSSIRAIHWIIQTVAIKINISSEEPNRILCGKVRV
jgi:hypothetical protein